ncbi:DMT family transporter [Aureliella helgolandensis]|uniref:EamA-like transporter family protein n=1 Tax=Aureliella helgolandensis TaxID=2527968 RepID=A0A518GGZ7_9BACT|nr:DMT family transporter [Aureliella helgolandensis]QDV27876.1 EamA-like transporter family protein [Aureliella helgolandensis]
MTTVPPGSALNRGQVSDGHWGGRLQIVLAAVLWSTSGFFAKAPWFDAWPDDVRGIMLAFWRSFFAMLVLLPLIRRPQWRWPMAPMMICFATMVWSFMSAMVHGPAANAIWLQYLCPAWVFLVGLLFLKERVRAADVWMFCFCLGGVLLILCMEMWQGSQLYATTLGILSGVSFAGVLLSMRTLRDVDPTWLILLNHSATVAILSPWVLAGRQSHVSTGSYIALALFGVFQMSLPYVLFARGLRTTSSPEASVLALIEPILVPIWVFVAWHTHPTYEAPAWWAWAGAGLILIGLLNRYLPRTGSCVNP